jgi:hypothetical protein
MAGNKKIKLTWSNFSSEKHESHHLYAPETVSEWSPWVMVKTNTMAKENRDRYAKEYEERHLVEIENTREGDKIAYEEDFTNYSDCELTSAP